MSYENRELLELARKIVAAHGQDHIHEFESIGLQNHEDMAKHVYNTLLSQETKLITCRDNAKSERGENSTNSGVCFAYNEKTNTMLVFSLDNNDFSHTAYRPNDGKERFIEKTKNVTKDQAGQAPEIKHGIYELMPEIKRAEENELTAQKQRNVGSISRNIEAQLITESKAQGREDERSIHDNDKAEKVRYAQELYRQWMDDGRENSGGREYKPRR